MMREIVNKLLFFLSIINIKHFRYSDWDLKGTLSEMINVTKIPTLVLMDRKGEVVSTNARRLVEKVTENLPLPS